MPVPLEGTRLKVLSFIQKQGSATVEQIAQELNLSPVTIRRHLDILQRDRLVSYNQVRRKAGRPEFDYFLTEEGYESGYRDYQNLLTLFLNEVSGLTPTELGGKSGEELLQYVIHRMSDQVSGSYLEMVQSSQEARLAKLKQALSDRGFSPEITLEQKQVQIRLCNCPFRASALSQKLLCRFDQRFIANILGVEPVCEYTIHDGDNACCYSVAVGSP